MNPFTGQLDRIGFFVWTVLLIVVGAGSAILLNSVDPDREGAYWVISRVAYIAVLIPLSLLVSARRLQNAGLSGWFAIPIALVPFLGALFWLALFVIPPKIGLRLFLKVQAIYR